MSLNEIHGFDAMLARVSTEFPSLKLHVRRTDEGTIVTAASGDTLAVSQASEVARVGAAARAALVDLHTKLVVRDREVEGLNAMAAQIRAQVSSLPQKREELTTARQRALTLENAIAVLGEDLHTLNDVNFSARMSLIVSKRTELTELQARILELRTEVQNLEGLAAPQTDAIDDDDDDAIDDDDYCY